MNKIETTTLVANLLDNATERKSSNTEKIRLPCIFTALSDIFQLDCKIQLKLYLNLERGN